VAGVLIAAALILIVAVHILDVHAEQQCAHLEDLTRRSLQKSQEQTGYQSKCGESQQLCCCCGSVRNRRVQISSGYDSHLPAKGNPKFSTASGLLQPLMDVASGKSALNSASIECLPGLTSKRKKMANGFYDLQGGWFNAGYKTSRANKEQLGSQRKPQVDTSQKPVSATKLPSVDSSSSTIAGSINSSSRRVDGSDSNSNSLNTNTITINSRSDPASSSSSFTSSSEAHSSTQTTGNGRQSPQRRLVLEILMSPSASGIMDC
jgi:hypothetical protein